MKRAQVAAEIEKMLQDRFPGTVVSGDIDQSDDSTFDVFMIPDGRMKEFTCYRMDDLPPMLEAKSLQHVSIIPHSESATKKYYPAFFAEFSKETEFARIIASVVAKPLMDDDVFNSLISDALPIEIGTVLVSVFDDAAKCSILDNYSNPMQFIEYSRSESSRDDLVSTNEAFYFERAGGQFSIRGALTPVHSQHEENAVEVEAALTAA